MTTYGFCLCLTHATGTLDVVAYLLVADNTARRNTIFNAGPPPKPRDPWDEPTDANVTGTVNATGACAAGGGGQFPTAAAAAVIKEAGPRPV